MVLHLRAAPFRGNHRNRAASLHLFEQPVRVERLVADQGPERKALEKVRFAREVVRLARKDHEPHKKAERGHELAGQPAPGAADPLAAGPPFAPVAFWRA